MKNKLSFLAVLFLTVCTFAAPSAPPEFTGIFGLAQDGVQLVSAKHELIVFVATKPAQDFVANLRANEYACQNFDARHLKCSRFVKDLQTIGSAFPEVYEKYQNEKLEIFESRSALELVNDAEAITEWKKSQSAKWLGQEFTDLHYTIIKDSTQPENLIKMKFDNSQRQNAYFYLVGGDIAFQQSEVLKLKPARNFVIKEVMNCLLEVRLVK